MEFKQGIKVLLLIIIIKLNAVSVNTTTLGVQQLHYTTKVTIHAVRLGNSMICSDIWHKYHE